MNIVRYSLEQKRVVYLFLAILLIGGVLSFFRLAKKEDAPFIIKTAVLVTQYPGATPLEVEELITEPIEREIQSMSEVWKITSESRFGLSKINIELDPTISPERMPIKWDELRRKVANITPRLPAGASAITVNDDFGDVYGIYYALTAETGYTYGEMRAWAQRIKTDLTPLEGVQKVMLFGEQQEVVNISISTPMLANLGVDPNTITNTLQTQNQLVPTGVLQRGSYQVQVVADGTYQRIEEIADQLIVTRDGNEVRLGDVAEVSFGYLDPPTSLMRVNGLRAIGIGVASGADDNVVAVGDRVDERLAVMQQRLPVGMEIETIYPENEIAREANNGFIVSLLQSLLIVIVVIFVVMGTRAGVLIGSSLLFSVGGTLLIMLLMGVSLNRTSLAAFIIAMGMLVDNAIVVTDNAQVGIKRGMKRYEAIVQGATVPQWGLLGATFIAICSFLPMYLAPAAVAEIVKPLFIVLAVSLSLSWVLALTQTTTFGNFLLKQGGTAPTTDPFDTRFYRTFGRLLKGLIRWRYLTLLGVVGMLVLSLVVLGRMPQSFFPTMDKPYFRADLLFPEGFSIDQVAEEVAQIESYLDEDERIKSYSFTLGSSPIRYYLASSAYGPIPNYANLLVETHTPEEAAVVEQQTYDYLLANYPNIIARSSLFMLSPVPDAKIEVGFVGESIDTLIALTQQAQRIARSCDLVMDVRSSWGDRVPVWAPTFSQERGLRLGITRQQSALAMRGATTGIPLGTYRQGDQFMPILLKDAAIDTIWAAQLRTLPVFSTRGVPIKLEQVIDAFKVDYSYNVIKRYNRSRVMLMQCEPLREANGMAAFQQVYSAIREQMTLPAGYELLYFGDQDQQDQGNEALAENVPFTLLLIYITLLLLFPRHYREPLVIMAMLPLIFIGVVWGLLLLGKSLDFFSLLGLLGLLGMNIKNAIVLIDQLRANLRAGIAPLEAVVEATKTRIVPVSMASGTTILGMIPLLSDSMFGGMAATIMGGLLMATLLTIFVLPVAYALFFQIPNPPKSERS